MLNDVNEEVVLGLHPETSLLNKVVCESFSEITKSLWSLLALAFMIWIVQSSLETELNLMIYARISSRPCDLELLHSYVPPNIRRGWVDSVSVFPLWTRFFSTHIKLLYYFIQFVNLFI